ncbi:isochorismatase family protein [Pseudonocardiaceae bacterium YIM PH 21723]|nr:isochorismatase family protein [Pseudonocardiaceae bacterium YIM PH 21723]
MTTLTDRPNTALLVIDVQVAGVADAYQRDAVVANIGLLVERARQSEVPVVWVRHSGKEVERGSAGWQIVPELVPGEHEALVDKEYPDSFEDTDLEAVLAKVSVGKVLVTGAATDMCVRSTLHGALGRGYDAILVADAHTTNDFSDYGAPTPDKVIAHTNMYWERHWAPGRVAGTVLAADVEF